MKKNRIILFTLGVIILLVIFAICLGKRVYTHAHNAQIEIANLYEAMAITPVHKIDSLPHHVLCIGNSITYMNPSDAIGWKGKWGMAASKAENDYVHLLKKKLKSYNTRSTVSCINVVSWEKDPTKDIRPLLRDSLKGKDIIVVRIGDNVENDDVFREGLQQLIDICKQYSSKILSTGCFWKRMHTESVLISIARNNHLKYVPLFWIGEIYGNTTYCQGSEIFYDTQGNPYHANHPAFSLHPNDKGMEMIAETLFDSLFEK